MQDKYRLWQTSAPDLAQFPLLWRCKSRAFPTCMPAISQTMHLKLHASIVSVTTSNNAYVFCMVIYWLHYPNLLMYTRLIFHTWEQMRWISWTRMCAAMNPMLLSLAALKVSTCCGVCFSRPANPV